MRCVFLKLHCEFFAAVLALCAAEICRADYDTHAIYPYGVCGHVMHVSPAVRARHLDAMQLAGIKYVRSGIHGYGDSEIKYADETVDALEKRGMKLLMILSGNEKDCCAPPKDMIGYSNSVDRIVRRYGDRVPVFEICNEANLDGFFHGADPATYAKVLNAAYAAGKAANPKCRFTFTGTAGIPLKWIEDVYMAGGTNFDAMAVHPYSHPYRPEGVEDVNTERLKELMAKYGIGDRPIWFTEVGWPTHTESLEHSSVFLAGLKVARPDQKSWNVIVARDQSVGEVNDQDIANRILELLPAGSRVKCCSQEETVARLAKDDADAVVYPFDRSFPADTIEAVNGFIARGGVFVDFGGLPCYFGRRNNKEVEGMQNGGAVGRFPFGFRAWWTTADGRHDPEHARDYPEEAQVFGTEVGLENGVKQEPTGFRCSRFLAPDRIGPESEWIPLVAGKATNGLDLVAAAVVRYHGDRKGAAVLSSLPPAYISYGTLSEETQARYTARCAAIAMAEGVEAHFPYALWTKGEDPYYSEHHFSLLQENYAPKPAFSAYMTFITQRPAGSVQAPGEWHDEARQFYFPQWTRPDGKKAGMLWSVKGEARRAVRFKDGRPVFRNLYGRRIPVLELEDGVFNVPVSESPVYFEGAEMVDFTNKERGAK